MANKIFFIPNQVGKQNVIYRIAADGVDTSSVPSSYKAITCTDDQFNKIRLDKANVSYDASDNLTFEDQTYSWASHDELRTLIDGMQEGCSHADWKTQITTLQSKDFTGETFPCSKSVPELAEEKGMTWKSSLQFL